MRVIDISVTVGQTVPVWEGDTPPLLIEEKNEYEQGTIQTTTVTMNIHTGTHIDAPRHFYPDGKKAEDIFLYSLMGDCLVVEIPEGIDTFLFHEFDECTEIAAIGRNGIFREAPYGRQLPQELLDMLRFTHSPLAHRLRPARRQPQRQSHHRAARGTQSGRSAGSSPCRCWQ